MEKTKNKKIFMSIAIGALLFLTLFIAYILYIHRDSKVETKASPTVSEPKKEIKPATITELLTLVNAERAKVGVAPLIIDERLNMSAQAKADDMFTRNYNDHVDPDGYHGYMYINVHAPNVCNSGGENLVNNVAKTNFDASAAVVNSWVYSPSHYAAMIDPNYDITGFGISGTKVVEHFCDLR